MSNQERSYEYWDRPYQKNVLQSLQSRTMNVVENYSVLIYQWLALYHAPQPDNSIDTFALVEGDKELIERMRHDAMQHYISNLSYCHNVFPTVFLPFDAFQLWLESERCNGQSSNEQHISGEATKVGTIMKQYYDPIGLLGRSELDEKVLESSSVLSSDLVSNFLGDKVAVKKTVKKKENETFALIDPKQGKIFTR